MRRSAPLLRIQRGPYSQVRSSILRYLLALSVTLVLSLLLHSLKTKDIQKQSSRTLITYVIANPDATVEENIRFFLHHGVRDDPRFFYVFVIQMGARTHSLVSSWPKLPPNSKIVLHENECYDIGTVGWLLFESNHVELKKFDFFLWMNPSVRGPFVPSWFESQSWPLLFTDALDATIKLSGTVISCGGIVNEQLGARANPHLQSYLLATDVLGLKILKDAGVFDCFESYTGVIYHGELGASLSILKAGFNIHSLMLRYKNVDWRDTTTWNCNGNMAPMVPQGNNGSSIDPLEVVFVKVKEKQLGWESSKRALAYSDMLHDIESCIHCRASIGESVQSLSAKLNFLKEAFDASFYQHQSRDLLHMDKDQLWDHFVENGLNEQRPFALEISGARREFPFGVLKLEELYEFWIDKFGRQHFASHTTSSLN